MAYPSNITQGVPAAYQGGGTFVPDSAYQGGGWYSYGQRGTHYSYGQLQRLWLNAGGNPQLAPTMAAIAEQKESGGWNGAWNSSGATGLWQIEWPGSAPPGWSRERLFNPLENAKAAARLSGNSMSGIQSNWAGDLNGLQVPGTPPSKGYPQAKGLTGTYSTMSATTTSSTSGPNASLAASAGNVLSAGSGMLHGAAVMLDRFFALGAPGQGWRFVFGLGMAGGGFASYRAFTSGDDGDGNLPLAIAFAGVAAICAFMTLRQWPQAGGKAIKPGAYVVDVLRDEPPPSGPSSLSSGEVDLTETALGGMLGLWAAGKVAQGISAGSGAVSSIMNGILGYKALTSGGAGDVTPTDPVPVPDVVA
ncbi:MAG: transglycosylase SLT domain-containing protein [Streptosporangiaceae bacterium]